MKVQILNTTALAIYYTTAQITDKYYDKPTIDNYIDATNHSTYVLEIMYTAGGHQYFIAVDPATSTTDAQFIINNAQKTPLVKFDTNGSKFYYPLVANTITTLDANGNPSMIVKRVDKLLLTDLQVARSVEHIISAVKPVGFFRRLFK